MSDLCVLQYLRGDAELQTVDDDGCEDTLEDRVHETVHAEHQRIARPVQRLGYLKTAILNMRRRALQ